jgi:hypothetical protein
LYTNFEGITLAFREVVNMDNIIQHELQDVLTSMSPVYSGHPLWTYGFIRALLYRCSLTESEREHAEMMSFGTESLHVKKCSVVDVRNTMARMKEEKKLIPFFILDEMTPNSNQDGQKLAAFQRNVFRACQLLVIVMGTDSKISDLVEQSSQSYNEEHTWMALVPRFPRYQLMLQTPDVHKTWSGLKRRWRVLRKIVKHSRGRFARNFFDKVIECANEKGLDALTLPDLLDTAFDHVAREAIQKKGFMDLNEGREAQLMAISYTIAESIEPIPAAKVARGESKPPAKRKAGGAVSTSSSKRRKVGAASMHLHFANLVDEHLMELTLRMGKLESESEIWRPTCRFPTMKEDVLLYLAVLGGKKSGYSPSSGNSFSVKQIFSDYLGGKGYPRDENLHAPSNDYKTFENMVAHAVFCASRRNGVQGIRFPAFFDCLIGEFQHDRWEKTSVGIQGVLETLADNAASLQDTVIPFLGPPNAKWPKYILDAKAFGCNFGHLVRAVNSDQCDLYVQSADSKDGTAPFLCECKHWKHALGMSAMNGIVAGVESAWSENWSLLLLFCTALAEPTSEWGHADIACVKINCGAVEITCGKGAVEWVSEQPVQPVQPVPRRDNRPVRKCTVTQPKESQPKKKLVIVVETGQVGSFEEVVLSDSHNLKDSQDPDSDDEQDEDTEDEQYREVVLDSELEMKKEPST